MLDIPLSLRTLSLNFCSSLFDMMSAFAITGMTFTLLSKFFIVSKSKDFKLRRKSPINLYILAKMQIVASLSIICHCFTNLSRNMTASKLVNVFVLKRFALYLKHHRL